MNGGRKKIFEFNISWGSQILSNSYKKNFSEREICKKIEIFPFPIVNVDRDGSGVKNCLIRYANKQKKIHSLDTMHTPTIARMRTSKTHDSFVLTPDDREKCFPLQILLNIYSIKWNFY